MSVEQVGGSHYGGGEFQHWDFIVAGRVDYLIAVATKYLARWRDKDGIQDVRKAISYVDKCIEKCLTLKGYRPMADHSAMQMLWPAYMEKYKLPDLERGATYELFFSTGVHSLEHAKETMGLIIANEVFSWPEMKHVTSSIKPDGWQGFTFEGSKKDFSWFRCIKCRAQFPTPIDAPPMAHHACPQKAPDLDVPNPDLVG